MTIATNSIARNAFRKASDILQCSDEMCSLIESNQRSIEVEIPVRRKDGNIKVYRGFRVQHSNARGPFKGGLRYHPDVDHDHFSELAFIMSCKSALMNIPFGGAKGGIRCSPEDLDSNEL
ncbi:MAG: hypothetical protein H7A04_17295 [Pseudomonadales bacterium]|nr:hypothetical protein [Pseudomonadales bacterium]MCP5348608.1 hypothetical protein [Pseudomonadales bacterium]